MTLHQEKSSASWLKVYHIHHIYIYVQNEIPKKELRVCREMSIPCCQRGVSGRHHLLPTLLAMESPSLSLSPSLVEAKSAPPN